MTPEISRSSRLRRKTGTTFAKRSLRGLVGGGPQLFPDGIRDFDRQLHDGIVLDDLRDFQFLVRHQEKMQGKVDRVVTFAETPSGGYAYKRWLWKVPIVVTGNFTTKNPGLLETDDFLGHSDNRVVVRRGAASAQ